MGITTTDSFGNPVPKVKKRSRMIQTPDSRKRARKAAKRAAKLAALEAAQEAIPVVVDEVDEIVIEFTPEDE